MKTYRELLMVKAGLGAVCLFGLLLPELVGTIIGVMIVLRDYGDAFVSGWGILGEMLLILATYMLMLDWPSTLMKIWKIRVPNSEERPKKVFWVKVISTALVTLVIAVYVFLLFCDINVFLCPSPHSAPFRRLQEEHCAEVFFLERAVCFSFSAGYIAFGVACDIVEHRISDKADLEKL